MLKDTSHALVAGGGPLSPVGPRFAPLFAVVLLTAASLVASLALACATPFAAYAVVAAGMLSLPAALAVTVAAWIVNQAIGFGVLHYPHDATTLAWGLAIGLAALAATVVARGALRALAGVTLPFVLGAALVSAYAAYEIVLFAFTFVLGGEGAFTAAIVARFALLNALWLMGLVAVCWLCRLTLHLTRRHALS